MYTEIQKHINQTLDALDRFVDWGGAHVEHMIARLRKKGMKKILLMGAVIFFILGGFFILWIATFQLPNLENFDERRIAQSTKIYDRTGDVVLFDVYGEVSRTVVPFDQISNYIKSATIAIEDANFYNHNGIEPKAILRAIIVNIQNGNLLDGQGGSTITQQVIKNALLTTDKKLSRKIKEWVLAPRLEQQFTKDQILETYLNEVPYGGTVYGVQEASRRFFGKDAKDVTLAEAAYLAALPQAPTRYSPYGNNTHLLDARKDRVLSEMLAQKLISQEEYDTAKNETVEFQKPENFGIKAPHFVFWIREQLEEKYGAEAVESGGLKVITTLDWKLQEATEGIVERYAFENSAAYDAENGAAIAIDPTTGQVLTMVGSRDYFDETIDGNFNIITAKRQPGSSFKPFIYAAAFNKGYRPETIVFDVPTEFSTTCASGGECYNPSNYDGGFRGPMSLRAALAQSINIPAIKLFYLAGLRESLELAKAMGISTLGSVDQYGLTLVLGGGEVTPLDMAAAYGVFATEGVKHTTVGILKVEDKNGRTLEEYKDESSRILPEETTRLISSILSDNDARAPIFGSNSYLHFPGMTNIAVKTGTTNNYRDAWIVGYTPSISIAAWVGNNDNRPIEKKAAGFIVAPMWNEIMRKAIEIYPAGNFNQPTPTDQTIKPIIRGVWNPTNSSGNPTNQNIHSILHWVDKNNPLGAQPQNPYTDPQYALWELGVQAWVAQQGFTTTNTDQQPISGEQFKITSPQNNDAVSKNNETYVIVALDGGLLSSGEVYINKEKVGTIDITTNSFSFTPREISKIKTNNNTLRVIVEDEQGNVYEDTIKFDVR